MAHAAVNWVINEAEYPEGVKPSARWLLVQIADRANKDEWTCFPSHKTLAKDSGMTPRSVLSLLEVLEVHGFIRREKQNRADGTRSTDLITLLRRGENSSPPAPQSAAPGGAKVAAHNQGTEPGKEDVDARSPFERWWKVYPRKVAKAAAVKPFWAALAKFKCDTPLTALIEATERFAQEVGDRPVDKIPHPATWLNGERWNDEPDANRSQTDARRDLAIPDRVGERQRSVLGPMQSGAAQALDGRGGRRWRL